MHIENEGATQVQQPVQQVMGFGYESHTEMKPELGQWMTPAWAAVELVGRHFGGLDANDLVLEPSCGTGAFLSAVPSQVPAMGVEIDPALAERARRYTGREVVTGDFLSAKIASAPSVILGNPPFKQSVVQAFFERAWELLPRDGRVGFILPCYIFQTASTVVRLSKRWGMQQEFLPRNLFNGLRLPLCFAVLSKAAGREMVGFALYHETGAVRSLAARYRTILAKGERSLWAAVVRAAVECLGGRGQLQDIYREIQGYQPTENPFWHAKVRQTLNRIGTRIGPSLWSV